MTMMPNDRHYVPLSLEAQQAALAAADAAGMPLSAWLSQLIKYVGSMEQRENPQSAGAQETSIGEPKAMMLPIGALRPSTLNPESRPDERTIRMYMQTLEETGTLPPIVVRRVSNPGNTYEIVAGEQQWYAARRAQLLRVPALVWSFSDKESLVIWLREALGRDALGPLGQARCYRRLLDEYGISELALAEALDQPVAHVEQLLRLLELPAPVRRMIEDGKLTMEDARTLLDADDPEALAWEVVERDLGILRGERPDRPTDIPNPGRPDGPGAHG